MTKQIREYESLVNIGDVAMLLMSGDRLARTSQVIKHDVKTGTIETKNSIYKLKPKKK